MRVVRSLLGEIQRYSIELRAVRNVSRRIYEVSDRVGSCKENVRRNPRYSIELRVVRRMLGEIQGIRLS